MRFSIYLKKYCLLLLTLLIAQFAAAQRERNYIYLLDCTKSMMGYNGAPDIWKPTKDYLKSDIERQTPGTMVHVVPFQGKNLPSYSFEATKFNWKSMESDLDEIIQNVTNTNICDAWDLGLKFIDVNKDNYIYLLTDGVDNVKGTAELARRLREFCGKYRNTRAFYVLLTKNATKVDAAIRQIVDNCPDEMFVDISQKIIPFGTFDDNITIYANTLKLTKTHKLNFSAAGVFPASVVCNDENFSIAIEGGKIKDGNVSVKISPKKDIKAINSTLPDTYEFTFDVKAKGVQIINPTVKVVMTNKPERELEIISEEQDMGDAEWYDSFLFWGSKEPDTLKVDLKAIFNEEARKDGSTVSVKIADTERLKDYKLFFNGNEVTDGTIRFNANSMPANTTLSVVYNSDAKEGKRYLRIIADGPKDLESINGAPVTEFEVTTRGEYDVVWNPLKTILMWLCIIILAALAIWFLILKYIFFPTFKVGSVMVTDPYYSNIRLKGARRLIFSNKKIEQSALNRIFTGTVICNVNGCWSQPLIMDPAKKKIRVQRNRTYVFDPYGAQLNPHTDYVVDNTETNEKIKMTIN